MTQREAILLAALLVCVCIAVVLLVLYLRNRRGQEKIAESVDSFSTGGSVAEFSPADNSLARLQNSVSDLENMLLLERSNTAAESRKNADFVADVSHQLKTPLAGLRLYCEMEQKKAPTPHTEKELQLIEKMEKLIFSLLRLEKLRSDAYAMDFQYIRAENEIGALVDEFRHLFPKKKYSLTGSAVIRCDKTWLNEAVGNIIKNASEHTAQDGSVCITIESGERSTTVTIEDDGGGVPKEQLPLLFQRFFRTDSSAQDSAGIGLAITRAIIEKHHGTITAENGKLGLRMIMCFPNIDGSVKI